MNWIHDASMIKVLFVMCSIIISIEGINKVNSHQEEKSGHFFTQDNTGRGLMIEWHIGHILSSSLAFFKKEVSELASHVSAVSETEFLKNFPEAVSSGGFLTGCESLLTQDEKDIDWIAVERKLQEIVKQFYLVDMAQFGSDIINKLKNDVYYYALVRDMVTQELLGFMMSSITPELPKGDIKLISLIVSPMEQNRRVEKLLLDSLIGALPHIKRIFTMVRPTNGTLLNMFEKCGFTEDKNPVQDPHHPIDDKYLILEYKVE